MPYLHCPSCRLPTFSAAGYSTREECPRCGSELDAQPRGLFAAAVRDALPNDGVRPSSAAVGNARLAARVREVEERLRR
jgi:hypothetical protein